MGFKVSMEFKGIWRQSWILVCLCPVQCDLQRSRLGEWEFWVWDNECSTPGWGGWQGVCPHFSIWVSSMSYIISEKLSDEPGYRATSPGPSMSSPQQTELPPPGTTFNCFNFRQYFRDKALNALKLKEVSSQQQDWNQMSILGITKCHLLLM